MKIAIVAPSPVPFTIGGAENLLWGLQQYFNEETPHQCELVKLPSREHTFKDLIRSYLDFCRLDLSHFDMVISTKYPAWMVSHPNHVCYMLHKLRGLYDTYQFTGLPTNFAWVGSSLAEVRRLMDNVRREPDSNSGLMVLLECLLTLEGNKVPAGTLDFPGPFVREIIHFIDSMALATSRIVRYAAISANVRGRGEYFPVDAKVRVAYPPPRLTAFECGAQEYLFTVSRLDGPKRIGLLVEAMRHVRSPIPLYIAGTGPDEPRIKALAADDPRIRFLGFVNDRDVLSWYRDALAVPFIPYDEDYGLITIEAMMSGKPVLTLTDSGGPNEFVENGVTGYSVAPTPEALAESIDAICGDPAAAREMGRNALRRVAGIRWADVTSTLLGGGVPRRAAHARRRPRIAVALTFPVYPPRGGGQARVFHLYRQLARYADIELVTSCHATEPPLRREIAPGLVETRIPRSQAHQDVENEISRLVGWAPVTDVVMSHLYKLTSEFEAALSDACDRADVVVASHPYLGCALVECAGTTKPIWFEAHNVEQTLKRDILPDTADGQDVLRWVCHDEATCWKHASVVLACARQDIGELTRLYGSSSALTLEVPNGVAVDDVPFTSMADRGSNKRRLGFGPRRAALFMGSWHGPNITAVREILGCAEEVQDVTFVLIGSVCRAFVEHKVPANVRLLGVVDDDEKALLLGAVDFGLNPMTEGSGSNLKMLDYFASGTPVISTQFGARGIEVTAGTHFVCADEHRLVDAIRVASLMTVGDLQKMTIAARNLALEKYDWRVIADQFAVASGLSPSTEKPSIGLPARRRVVSSGVRGTLGEPA